MSSFETSLAASEKSYRPQLDGLRAICIIFTIFNHLPGAPRFILGSVGVDVFFALSGWLITWLLFTEQWRYGDISLKSFYVRRLFRIVPLYLVTVAMYFILANLGLKQNAAQEFRDALPYALTFNMEYAPASAGTMFGHGWTLGIEEKFYIFWPLFLVLAIPFVGRAWLMGAACVAIVIFLSGSGDRSTQIIRGYLGLGFGATAAFLVARMPVLRQFLTNRSLAGGCFALMLIPYVAMFHLRHPYAWNLALSFLAAVAIASMWMRDGQWISRLLAFRPLVWLGGLTYAIYLVQTIAIRGAGIVAARLGLPQEGMLLFVLAYGGAIGFAFLLNILIEQPMIRQGRMIARRFRATPARESPGGQLPEAAAN